MKQLIEDFRKIPHIDTSKMTGAELAWSKSANRLRALVFQGDIKNFLQWDVIQKTMHTGDIGYTKHLLNDICHDGEWDSLRKGLRESPVGNPSYSGLIKNTSGTLIHHVYHLLQLKRYTGMLPKDFDFVFEFGGGYGSMCRAFRNLGYSNYYEIFDIQAFSALQRFYLRSLQIENAVCKSEVSYGECATSKSLFIANWSMSESPLSQRLDITRYFKYFLITYQHNFKEVDNQDYFNKLSDARDDLVWVTYQHPYLKTSSYLIGSPR